MAENGTLKMILKKDCFNRFFGLEEFLNVVILYLFIFCTSWISLSLIFYRAGMI